MIGTAIYGNQDVHIIDFMVSPVDGFTAEALIHIDGKPQWVKLVSLVNIVWIIKGE